MVGAVPSGSCPNLATTATERLADEGQSTSDSGTVTVVEPSGTLQTPSGSGTYHTRGDTAHQQDDLWSQTNVTNKRRRIIGKQKDVVYSQQGTQVKRKTDTQGDSGSKKKSQSEAEAAKSLADFAHEKRHRAMVPRPRLQKASQILPAGSWFWDMKTTRGWM